MEIRKEKAVVEEADEDEEIWPVSSHIHKIQCQRMAMSISGTGFKMARKDAASTNLCPLLCIFNGLILTTPHELCIRIFHFYSQIYHHWIIC